MANVPDMVTPRVTIDTPQRFSTLKGFFLDVVAIKTSCLSILCLIVSIITVHRHMRYLIVYFFVTIAWAFGSFPLHVICLLTPVGLEFICGVWIKCPVKGFLLEESLGIVAASIFFFTFKTNLVTRKVTLNLLIRFPMYPHNLLAVIIASSVTLGSMFPDYAVVLIILPFVECAMDIMTSIDSKMYIGESMQKQAMQLKQFDKTFKLAICYSATIGSVLSVHNSEIGEIAYKMLYHAQLLDFDLWFKVVLTLAVVNSIILWFLLMIIFLGPCFMKHCLYLNVDSIRKIFKRFYFRKKIVYYDKGFKMYLIQLDSYRKEIGYITLRDLFMIIILIIVIIMALTRKSLSFTGWSDYFLDEILGYEMDAEYKQIRMSFILCMASIILFLVPSNKLPFMHLPKDMSSDMFSITSHLHLPISDWELVCRYIPWTAILCIGAANNLYYVYQQTEVCHRVSIGLAYILGPDKTKDSIFLLYYISTLLNIFNFNANVAYIMTPIAIHIARYKNMNATKFLLYALHGSRNSFITPFSSRANLLIFFMTQTVKRKEMLKAGLPMTILCTTTTLLLITAFFMDMDDNFNPNVLPNVGFNLVS